MKYINRYSMYMNSRVYSPPALPKCTLLHYTLISCFPKIVEVIFENAHMGLAGQDFPFAVIGKSARKSPGVA